LKFARDTAFRRPPSRGRSFKFRLTLYSGNRAAELSSTEEKFRAAVEAAFRRRRIEPHRNRSQAAD
jgi:hypothetical protein